MTDDIFDTGHFEQHITVTNSTQTAIDVLAENTPLSKQKLKMAMNKGAVWLESDVGIHRMRRAKKTLSENNIVHLYYDEAILSAEPEAAELIADEGTYSIWNKPYGMYSQGSKWGDHCSIYRWAENHLKPERPAFLVHRLDRAAHGLIMLAHTKKMAALLSALFEKREIQKQYKATVEGVPENLELPLLIDTEIDGKPARSHIIALTPHEDSSEVIMEIESGRKHQVRIHMAELGYPIVGDRLYGAKQSKENLQLQSNYLKFTCPISSTVREYSL